MKLADKRCHLVLNYIAAMHHQGVTLTAEEINAYAARAERKPRGGWQELSASTLQTLEGKVREPALVWLLRVGWVELHGPTDELDDENFVTITETGQAALRALDEAAEDEFALNTTVALDAKDPMALSKVIERIMGMGRAALVDRFFGPDVFLAVAQRTKIERILTGPSPKKRLAGVQQALDDVLIEREFDVRVDEEDQYHDRFVIPDTGSVWALGTSISGVGVRHSVMTEIKGPVAEAIRKDFENAWCEGRPLNPAPATEEPSGEGEASRDDADATEV